MREAFIRKKFKLASILLLFIGLCLLIPFSKASEATPSSDSKSIEEFEKFVSDQMALDRAPGLSVGFLKGDCIWSRGFGYSDLENMVPAKPESAYRLASLTKSITAIAVLQLVEAGKIDLDAEVQTYVPYFPRKKWPVTVRLLLGHLGGISAYKNHDLEERIKVHKNTKEALAIFQDFDLVAEPGTKYNYSSYGYNLLGAVIEGASEQPYGDYIKEHIFEPLGMSDSRLDDPSDLISNRVRGYRLVKGEIKNSEYVDISSRFAAGGTRSTVADLLKYAQGIIGGKLLKAETWKQMFTSMATKSGFFTEYGMGWHVRPQRGHFQVSHTGSQPETMTCLLIFPLEKFAIAAASNLEGINLLPYVRRLAELVLNEDLDSSAYASEIVAQVIYNNCYNIFSYGLSRFTWEGKQTAKDEKELAEAFSYFNRYCNKASLEKNFSQSRKMIENGFHPVSNQALIKVGVFMASALKESLGDEKLKSYYQSGPIPFFNDYIEIGNKWPASQKKYRFDKSFIKLVSDWNRDWNATYTDYVRNLFLTGNTDFDEIGLSLKKIFSGRTLYPDFTSDMEQAGNYFLERNEIEKALKVFGLSCELYPNSSLALTNFAKAQVWTGNSEEAGKLFKKAFSLDPEHPRVSKDYFFSLASQLERAGKLREIFALADIALELYPKDAGLHKDVGDMYLKIGKREKALELYKKALEIDPKFEEARKAAEKIEKEKNR
jgi:CubicO group peptidase (beta-lactamase class C family)